MTLQVARQTLNRSNRGRAEVVFHSFHVVVNGLLVEPKQLEERGEEPVAVGDAAREGFACRGEHESPIFFVLQKAFSIEALDHIGHARLGDGEARGNVDDARVAFGADEFENLLEVVLDGGGCGAQGRPQIHGWSLEGWGACGQGAVRFEKQT
ncbi:MAG: hypothetical protein RLZZ142_519 [Verrucomicrobiota bacterium]